MDPGVPKISFFDIEGESVLDGGGRRERVVCGARLPFGRARLSLSPPLIYLCPLSAKADDDNVRSEYGTVIGIGKPFDRAVRIFSDVNNAVF